MKFAVITHFHPSKRSHGQKFVLKTRWWTADARSCSQSIGLYSKRLSRDQKIQNRYSADADGNAYWRNMANAIEPSVCGGDVALGQITLTSCYYYTYITSTAVEMVNG